MHATTGNPYQAAADVTSVGTSLAKPLEFLAFTLGQEEYGIDIQKVQELRGYDTVTRIANAPELGAVLNTGHLIGLGMCDERMQILVGIDKPLTSSEIGLVAQTLQ